MSILLIAGSPSERSRTAALLDAAGRRLEARGALVERLRVRKLSPQALPLVMGSEVVALVKSTEVSIAKL